MTAFATNQLPTNINTLEELVAWGLMALYDLQKLRKYKEVNDADLVPVVTSQQGLAADDTERLIFRVSFDLDPTFNTGPAKGWEYVREFAQTAIPARFTTN